MHLLTTSKNWQSTEGMLIIMTKFTINPANKSYKNTHNVLLVNGTETQL